MLFAISGNHLKCLNDYDAAYRWFEQAKPINGDCTTRYFATDQHQPGAKRRPHYTIECDGPGREVRCCYHGTALVTYKPDGWVDIRSWDSISSGIFATLVAPSGISVKMTGVIPFANIGGSDPWWDEGRRAYRFGGSNTIRCRKIDGEWEVDPDTTHPWQLSHVNRPAFAALWKEHNGPAFQAFATTYIQLENLIEYDPKLHWNMPSQWERLSMMKSAVIENWITLIRSIGPTAVQEMRGDLLHQAAVDRDDVLITTEVPWIKPIELGKYEANHRKYNDYR